MTKKTQAKMSRDKIMLTQHTMEIRHEPSGSFLDVRGYVADYIRNKKLFPHWKIDANIVSFRDAPDRVIKDAAVAGYKSAGYLVLNPETRNYFVDKASAFWKVLSKNEHYELPAATRFGCRTQVFVPTSKTFDQVKDTIFNAFYNIKARELIGGKENDFQVIFDFSEGQYKVNLSGGPIHKNEATKLFSFKSEHFKKCGLFLDIDYYKIDGLNNSSIKELLAEASKLSWNRIESIANSLKL